MVYRMPLDGSSPSALGVNGAPIDQFSFLQSEDGNLNVLVRADSVGDGMSGAEMAAGDVALLRVPLTSFSDGSQDASNYNYRRLPKPSGYTFQNRFVGNYLLYGTGAGWGYPQQTGRTKLVAVRWAGGEVHQILLPHGIDRIEQLGSDAVVIGTDGKDLHFSAVRLGEWPEVADRYTRAGASQAELRSQGFFSSLMDWTRVRWDSRLACPCVPVTNTCFRVPQQFSFSETIRCTLKRWESSHRVRTKRSTTLVALRALTGMATRVRYLCAAASWL